MWRSQGADNFWGSQILNSLRFLETPWFSHGSNRVHEKFLILYVQEVLTHFIKVTYYKKWINTSGTYSIHPAPHYHVFIQQFYTDNSDMIRIRLSLILRLLNKSDTKNEKLRKILRFKFFYYSFYDKRSSLKLFF